MLLSVIIVTYHHENLVLNLLKSIELHNDIGSQLEVIVVDNSEKNEVYDFLNTYFFPFEIKKIKNINNGFGIANNIGASVATSEHILFLNPDTVLVEPIFKYAIKLFERYDMFGLKLITTSGKTNFSYRYNKPYTLKSALFNRMAKIINIFNKTKFYIVGADIFIKKDLFFKSGCFDEKIFMYNEEFDLSKRVLKLSQKIGFDCGKKIVHLEGSGEYEEFDLEQRKRFLISFKYICKKYNINYSKQLKHQLLFLKIKKKISNCKNANYLIDLYLNEIKEQKK